MSILPYILLSILIININADESYSLNIEDNFQQEPIKQGQNFEASSLICLALYSKKSTLQQHIPNKIQTIVSKLPINTAQQAPLIERYIINSITNCVIRMQNKELNELTQILQTVQKGEDISYLEDMIQYDDNILHGMEHHMVYFFRLKIDTS